MRNICFLLSLGLSLTSSTGSDADWQSKVAEMVLDPLTDLDVFRETIRSVLALEDVLPTKGECARVGSESTLSPSSSDTTTSLPEDYDSSTSTFSSTHTDMTRGLDRALASISKFVEQQEQSFGLGRAKQPANLETSTTTDRS
jgi:hypothetical protein